MAERKLRAPRDARLGEVVAGKWEITSVLRVGNMASTYGARHRNGHRVALKVLHAAWSGDASLACRFTRSGYLANGVCHRGVVPAIDDGVTDDGCPFLVYTLLTGRDMEALRAERGQLPAQDVLERTIELLEILHAAHARGIVHRNLKPGNVFVTDDGEVKLLGFGASALVDGLATSDVTDAYTAVGTPAFMAPEQAQGLREDVDATTDVFGVGATMFTLLSGEHVHPGRGSRELLRRAAVEPARSLSAVAPRLPQQVVAVVDRALAFSREERWPSALIMAEALRWALRSLRGSGRTRRRLLAAPIALVEDPTVNAELGADDDITATDEVRPPSVRDETPAAGEPVVEAPPTTRAPRVPAPPTTREPIVDPRATTRAPVAHRRVFVGAALVALTLGIASGAGTRRWLARPSPARIVAATADATISPALRASSVPSASAAPLAPAPSIAPHASGRSLEPAGRDLR